MGRITHLILVIHFLTASVGFAGTTSQQYGSDSVGIVQGYSGLSSAGSVEIKSFFCSIIDIPAYRKIVYELEWEISLNRIHTNTEDF